MADATLRFSKMGRFSILNRLFRAVGITNKNRNSGYSYTTSLLNSEEVIVQSKNAVDCGNTKVKRENKNARIYTPCKCIQTLCSATDVDNISVYEEKLVKEETVENLAGRGDCKADQRTKWVDSGSGTGVRVGRRKLVRHRPGQLGETMTDVDQFESAMSGEKANVDIHTDALKTMILNSYVSHEGNDDYQRNNGICFATSVDVSDKLETIPTNGVSPLFEEEDRTSLFPIKYLDVWEMYKKAVASFWTIDDIDMSTDADEWRLLNEKETFYISRVLIFFLGADRLVNDNLLDRFTQDVKMFECLYFYQFQMAIENIHTETYNMLIETFVTDEHEREALFKSVDNYSSIAEKYNWCRRWTKDDNLSFAHRLVAFACVEGIFFSSSFAAIFWLKKRGILRGLCFSNELISRDEGLHCDFAVLLFKRYCPPIQTIEVRTIVSESCDIEKTFVRESVPSGLPDISAETMCAYVDYIGERLMLDLTGERLYPYTSLPVNPLHFMENITLQGKTNFFERKVSEYRVAGKARHE